MGPSASALGADVYRGKRFLGLVPARGGSVGLPRKHLLDLGGRPVMSWTALAARGSQLLDRVILSTDDAEIAEVGRQLGIDVPFMRPRRLATAEIVMGAVVEHAVTTLDEQWDGVVLLQPTSPLRTAGDIDAAIRIFVDSGAPTCVSVTPTHQHPAWTYRLDDEDCMTPFIEQGHVGRRQELDPAYVLNGAVYVLSANRSFRESLVVPGTRAYVMPAERSVDLDTEHDLRVLRALVEDLPG